MIFPCTQGPEQSHTLLKFPFCRWNRGPWLKDCNVISTWCDVPHFIEPQVEGAPPDPEKLRRIAMEGELPVRKFYRANNRGGIPSVMYHIMESSGKTSAERISPLLAYSMRHK